MASHVSFHVSKFQTHFDYWTRSAFLARILPISNAILAAVLVLATGTHQMSDQISK